MRRSSPTAPASPFVPTLHCTNTTTTLVTDSSSSTSSLRAPANSSPPPGNALQRGARAESAGTSPPDAADNLDWLEEFEIGAENSDRGSVRVGNSPAQMSQRLAPRLRTPSADAAWRRYTDSAFLHRVRQHGLELPLTGGVYPAPFDAGANSIKPEYTDWTRKAIAELNAVGAISTWIDHVRAGHATGDTPWLIMPLIVEPKPGRPGKFRLIHDCRHLNALLDKFPFKMESLDQFVKQLSFMDKLFSVDIESAYHHIEIAPRHRTLVGFRFENVTYVYNVLPFGLTTSASVFCAFTEVTARAVRASGLVSALIVYVDDFGGSVGQHRDRERMDSILSLICSFGWVLAPDKVIDRMDCDIKLLGFILDTHSMTINVPDGRRAKLEATARTVWQNRTCVPVRTVCQLAGQVMSMQLALGLVCRLRSRYLLHSVRDAARRNDYRGSTRLCQRAANEAQLFAFELDSLEAQPMHKHLRVADYVLHCDASDHALAAIVVKAPDGEEVRTPFYRRLGHHEATWSSSLRELTGYRDAYFTLSGRHDLRGRVVEIVGDSLCCHYIFRNGGSQTVDDETGQLLLTEVLLDLLSKAAADGAEVRFRWVRREFVQDADDLSKVIDKMDFGLRPDWLAYVRHTFGSWDIDRFAAAHNTTAARFNSLFDSTSSEAVDAMAQDWSIGVSYILPNFHIIDQILDKIERDNAEVVIIVPEWPHKAWWRRVYSGAWRARLVKAEMIPARTLTPYNDHCFFSTDFTTALLVMRTSKL